MLLWVDFWEKWGWKFWRWQVIDFARLNHSTISFFNLPESAASRWSRVKLNASKVSLSLSLFLIYFCMYIITCYTGICTFCWKILCFLFRVMIVIMIEKKKERFFEFDSESKLFLAGGKGFVLGRQSTKIGFSTLDWSCEHAFPNTPHFFFFNYLIYLYFVLFDQLIHICVITCLFHISDVFFHVYREASISSYSFYIIDAISYISTGFQTCIF